MRTFVWYVVLGALLIFLFWGVCHICATKIAEQMLQEYQQQERVIRDSFDSIQKKHGAVAVATDFSHFIRLNGEVCRLKDYEKPKM